MLLFVLGMVAWQFITFLVFVISGEDAEKTEVAGIGIFYPIALGILKLLSTIRNYIIDKTYVAYRVKRGERLMGEHFRIKPKNLHKYYMEKDNVQNYLVKSQWKPSSCRKITKVQKNGWFDQKWVDENIKKP